MQNHTKTAYCPYRWIKWPVAVGICLLVGTVGALSLVNRDLDAWYGSLTRLSFASPNSIFGKMPGVLPALALFFGAHAISWSLRDICCGIEHRFLVVEPIGNGRLKGGAFLVWPSVSAAFVLTGERCSSKRRGAKDRLSGKTYA